jgi:transcriptional regulator of acetoin/glycerol metabolism
MTPVWASPWWKISSPKSRSATTRNALLVKSGMTPTKAARPTGLGRSTLYREIQELNLRMNP